MKRLLSLTLLCYCTLLMSAQVKVACVGNSITYGLKLENRETEAYPSRLQELLGEGYVVGNFGKSGATLLRRGHKPYIQQKEYQDALAFAGDIVVIHLGINDTDPRNWPNYRDDFVGDYHALINSFREVNPSCKVLIARMSPISNRHTRFDSGTRSWFFEIQNAIECVARHADVQLIDFYEPLLDRPVFFPDGLHPNAAGAEVLARVVYEGITGNVGGLQLSGIYTDNMVLQRNRPLTISGKANAGSTIKVSIGKHHTKTVVTANGKWSATLPPLEAGGPYTLTIASGKEKVSFKNVLVGEVWLCSGQSNMEWAMQKAATAMRDIPQANRSDIRLYNMRPRWRFPRDGWTESVLDSINSLEYFKETVWENCTPESVKEFSAIAYYFGKMLADSLQVPVGLICNALGGSPIEAWVERETLEEHFPAVMRNWTKNDFIQKWVRERAIDNLKHTDNPLQRHPYEPSYLYETAIRPIQHFAVQGVIWYQGESNAHNVEAHEKLFKLLVEGWRKSWKNSEMPFYYVQLSSMDRPSWCWFRDSQRRLMQHVSHTGMAVCSDVGDSLDVHPRRKQEVGERLAYWALHKTYGNQALCPSGPLYRNVTYKAGAAYLTFDYADGLTTSDGKTIRTFEVAGDDGLYHPAHAVMEENIIKVWSEQVKSPTTVRYGWQPYTRANLVNRFGLPASTFQTLITE